ncbi:MAG: caspase family protein, partial [Spirulinaceae cyanobacterium]
MAKYSCIAVGINQYQFLQPLSYAQADAFGLRQFFVKETNLSPQQCLLLTEASPWVERQSTYPTKENILSWLEKSSTETGKPNILWFLFSGYGINWQGEDYLIPIDGNPKDIPNTAIPLESLLTTLQKQAGDNVLVLLDINRSPGIFAGASVGAQTAALAREMGIALILSTQVNEYSHESASLGRGFFTEALLEALDYYHEDLTLEVLENYLRYRLPEIGEHHWRPAQTPIIITPSPQAGKGKILPGSNEVISWNYNSDCGKNTSNSASTDVGEKVVNHHNNGAGKVHQTGVLDVEEISPHSSLPSQNNNNGNGNGNGSSAIVFKPKPPQKKNQNWSDLILWGGGTALATALIIAAVAITKQDNTRQESFAQTQGQVEAVTPSSSPATDDNTPVIPPNPQVTISAAQAPTPPQPTAFSSSEIPPESPPLQATNQGILNQARTYIQANQASGFNQAINEVRKIQPGQPFYEQAQ